MARYIDMDSALQAHPEFLNEQIDDHDKAVYAKGWNDCNKEYYNSIAELPVASMACTDLSTRLRRAFEADELVNQRLLLDAADAIEELKFENEILSDGIDDLKAEVKRLEELLAAVPPPLWTDEPIERSEFVTHNQGGGGFEIHFRTDSLEKYKAVQEECRRQIDHANPEPPKEVQDG